MFVSKCWFSVTWKWMHARVISEMDARKGLLEHWCAQPQRPFWRMHATDFLATDTRKVWAKSRMRATYIPDARNPSNLMKQVHSTNLTFFVPVQKKCWKIDPHVLKLRSRWFLFQGVQKPLNIWPAPGQSGSNSMMVVLFSCLRSSSWSQKLAYTDAIVYMKINYSLRIHQMIQFKNTPNDIV